MCKKYAIIKNIKLQEGKMTLYEIYKRHNTNEGLKNQINNKAATVDEVLSNFWIGTEQICAKLDEIFSEGICKAVGEDFKSENPSFYFRLGNNEKLYISRDDVIRKYRRGEEINYIDWLRACLEPTNSKGEKIYFYTLRNTNVKLKIVLSPIIIECIESVMKDIKVNMEDL